MRLTLVLRIAALNLMVLNDAIHWALVVQDTAMVGQP